MIASLWLVLLLLRAVATPPAANQGANATPNAQEPVIIIMR